MSISGLSCIFPSPDIKKTSEFYVSKLGFRASPFRLCRFFLFGAETGNEPTVRLSSSEAALRSVRRFPFYAIKCANLLSRFCFNALRCFYTCGFNWNDNPPCGSCLR